MDIIESVIYRRAYGLASDLAEARSHRLAGRLHDAPGAGGDATEALAELTAIHGVTTRDQGRIFLLYGDGQATQLV